MPGPTILSGAVEGPVDEAVLARLVREAGGVLGNVYGRQGKGKLVQRLPAYVHAARIQPWVVLLDLDRDADCVPPFLGRLPPPPPSLCLRVAVRAVEAWLLADRERCAKFLGITPSRIPPRPEELGDPKRAVVDLARNSRHGQIRKDMVPRPESGRAVGPAYTSRLLEFIQDREDGWRPQVAAESSESLERCQRCIRRLVEG